MYFDIILVEEPDANGNIITSYRKVTSPPEYPDIAPKDMSTTNQIKAGAQLEVVQNFKKGDNLRKSDFAESSLIRQTFYPAFVACFIISFVSYHWFPNFSFYVFYHFLSCF